jgi:hypothetical protein
MCMNCGCGELDKRHHATDIIREDLERAADGSAMSVAEAARNVARSSEKVAGAQRGSQTGTSAPWSTGKRV